jgi:asparagine synthase (glutamine-hydrolysing)
VAFSGGRDSSTVLAVATHVARHEGLPDPIPITRVFPDAPTTDESTWQEMVVRHLELDEWQRLVFHDEFDMVGPLAQSIISRNGVVWPPTLFGHIPVIESVSGGTLLDGEGGDEVLGVGAHRVAPLAGLLHSPRPLRWGRVRSALGAIAPRMIRRKYAVRRQQARVPTTWLRPSAHRALLDAFADQGAAQPLSFAASVRRIPRRRTQVCLAQNRDFLAGRYGVEAWSPLLDPEFVHAISRDGGSLGRGDRTAVLGALIPDLLPGAVLARTSKVDFRAAFYTRHTLEFAESWSGNGLNDDLVDGPELRRIWRSGHGNALTSALLQTAWLADHRSTSPPIDA